MNLEWLYPQHGNNTAEMEKFEDTTLSVIDNN
jgi:hypothetical protein